MNDLAFSWSARGDERGVPVVYFHGTPGSKDDVPHPDGVAATGVRLWTFDRPGYGASPAMPDASLTDVARHVLDDLGVLGVDCIGAVGWSGGGPFALACAAVAPDRVRAVGLVSSWAPMNPPDPGLPRGVRFAMLVAASLPRTVLRLVLRTAGRTSIGMVDDVRRVARPWRFDVGAVAARTPVAVWHPENDREVPIAPWRRMPAVTVTALPGDGHEPSPEVWRAALQWASEEHAHEHD